MNNLLKKCVFGLILSAYYFIPIGISAGTPWEQFHGTSSHQGTWDGNIEITDISSKWTLDPSAATDNSSIQLSKFDANSQVCLSSDGSTCFAFGFMDQGSKGQIVAIDTIDGEVLWATTVYAFKDFGSFSSPVFSDGYIYWIGSDFLNKSYVYKINAKNGSHEQADEGWILEIANVAIVNACPLVMNDNIFFSTYADFGIYNATHYALSVKDGSVIWKNEMAGGCGVTTWSYDETTKLLYQPTFIDKVQNISAFSPDDGSVVSTSSKIENALFCSALNCSGGKLYFQDYYFSGNGKIYAFDASDLSQSLWEAATPGSGDACPVVTSDGTAYSCGGFEGDGKTGAYNSDGTVLWTFEKAGGWTKSPAYADGYLFIGARNSNSLYLLDISKNSVDNDFIAKTLDGSGPVSFGKDDFYSIGTDGKLYCYTAAAIQTKLTLAVKETSTGSISPEAGVYDIKAYLATALTATPASGYVFDKWTLSGSGEIDDQYSASVSVTAYGELTATASFVAESTKYKLSISEIGTGGKTEPVAGSTTELTVGSEQSVTATADTGYLFSKWETVSGEIIISDTTALSTTVTLKSDATLLAVFEENTAVLTLESKNEGGTISPSEAQKVLIGVPEKITATAASGWFFVNWETDSSTAKIANAHNASTTATITEATKISANFAKSTSVPEGAKKRPKATIVINSKKPEKDKIQLDFFPLSEDLITVSSSVTVSVDGYEFSGMDLGEPKNNVYRYKSEGEPKILLTVDLNKFFWSFKVSQNKDGLSNIENSDGVTAILTIGEESYGGNYIMSEKSSWSFNDKKDENSSAALSVDKTDFTSFGINKANGKIISIEENKFESFAIKKAMVKLAEGTTFDSASDDCVLKFGDRNFNIPAGDPLMIKKKDNYYFYNDRENGVKMKLDLNKGVWSFQTKKKEVSSFSQHPSKGLEIYLTLGANRAGLSLTPSYKTILKYSTKK